MDEIKRYNLKTAFTTLSHFDAFAKPEDYMEVCMWHNAEGFDVNLNSNGDQRFALTWGQLKALKKLVKALDS